MNKIDTEETLISLVEVIDKYSTKVKFNQKLSEIRIDEGLYDTIVEEFREILTNLNLK